ncbi:MAG: hypothetical protein PHX08_18020, partial [Lachnospiraceae bacterium]|nr:hypothetical protein [Lachnospiraceae bacterium]
ADYKFYTEEFKGSTIPDTAFSSVILRASIFVKYITFGRVDESDDIPEEVRCASCAVADTMYKNDVSNKEKKSESVGNTSVSYVTEQLDGEISEKTQERKQYAAAYPYLVHTGLLYRGCR